MRLNVSQVEKSEINADKTEEKIQTFIVLPLNTRVQVKRKKSKSIKKKVELDNQNEFFMQFRTGVVTR